MTLAIIWVNYVRCPDLLHSPRFWAEEGTVYFSYAYSHSWIDNLITPHFGYYTLYNSLVTSFAATFPLDIAPLVTTYLAFAIQVLASFLVIWGEMPILDSPLKKFTVAISIPLLSFERIWLTTIGVQYWFCIITFFILLGDASPRKRIADYLKGAMLVMTGLTGVLSCFMTPAYLYRYVKSRSKKYAIYSAILGACSIIQIAVFVHAYIKHDPEIAHRLVHNNPIHLINKTIMFQFAVPFFGVLVFQSPTVLSISNKIDVIIIRLFGSSIFDSEMELLGVLAGIYVLIYLIRISIKKLNDINWQLIVLSFILVFILSTLLSLNMSGGPRYTFAPSIMILVYLISSWDNNCFDRFFKLSTKMMVILSLATHGLQYPVTMNLEGATAYSKAWPSWKDELFVWNKDNNYHLKIWPQPWEMTLQKQKCTRGGK